MPPLPPLRQLDLDDDADFALLSTCIAALYSELFGPSAVPDADAFRRVREQGRASSTSKHWSFVARDEGAEPRAFVMLAESFAVFAGGRYGIINELWVHPDRRSAGAGAQMIAFVRAFARRHGWLRVDVSAPEDPQWDRSVAFYRRQGFEPTGRKLKLRIEGS